MIIFNNSKLRKKVIRRKAYSKISLFCFCHLTIWLSIVLLVACKNDRPSRRAMLPIGRQLVFLDSARAARAILDDDAVGFFTKISTLDMSLQMKRNYPADVPRDSILGDYQQFLEQDVTHFSPGERVLLEKIFSKIEQLCAHLSPDVFPEKVELIKTKGRHYGNGVYYTRENRIVLPANELQSPNEAALREVLIHEIFHIYSRQHPGKRRALYALIGFRELDDVLVLPGAIKSRLLLNPDGVDTGVAILLAVANGDTTLTVPLITANAPAYLPSRPNYFEYIDFNLYPIQMQVNGYQVITDSLGRSPLRVNELPDFFRQITDNTFYIIHPDEILADNFKWLVLAQTGEKPYDLGRFSEAGQHLLKQMAAVLSEP